MLQTTPPKKALPITSLRERERETYFSIYYYHTPYNS